MEMDKAILNLGLFGLFFSTFIMAITGLIPSEKIGDVHTAIRNHFQLNQVADGIHNFDEVYAFVEAFEHHNDVMQPTSTFYWCEEDYFTLSWDEHLNVPDRHCDSWRQFTTEGHFGVKFGESTLVTHDVAGSAGSAGGGHRRLASSDSASSSASYSSSGPEDDPGQGVK